MRLAGRIFVLLAAGLATATMSLGYYHFVHFNTRTGPFFQIPEKFDLNALPNRSVSYFISNQGPSQVAPGDSFTAIVSEIRAAAKVWNDVDTSDLRVVFGGLSSPAVAQSSPGIDIVFDEVPPGLIAMGGPTVVADLASGPAGAFKPISRSVVVLRRDLSQRESFRESFFLLLVHEIGHALGLQHTFTSSAMSTEVTRGTTKARPLTADDIAGISLLYPARNFQQTTGSIVGRVTLSGAGVNLASVVALSPNGPAISALTNPDGTFTISGIPAGQYYVYAHPLPPAFSGQSEPGDIVPPEDLSRQQFPQGPSFDTVFFPGTRNPQVVVSVGPGGTVGNVNFAVNRRTTPGIYGVQTFSFLGGDAVKPAYINRNVARPWMVAAGSGLITGNGPTSGLAVSVIGGAVSLAPSGLTAYSLAPSSYVQLEFRLNLVAPDGPAHLLFTGNNDIYILPNAFSLVQNMPPSINSIVPFADPSGPALLISGSNFQSDTRILFDGQPGIIRSVDDAADRIVVTPPPAPSGYRAMVVALNSDGQSSLFVQSAPSYAYDFSEPPAFLVSPSALPAGSEAMVDIQSISSTSLADGLTAVAFGSSDVAVKRFWVSGNHVLANVSVAPNAASSAVDVTVATGLRVTSQPFSFQILPQNPRQLTVSLGSAALTAAAGAATVPTGLQPGGTGILTANFVSAPNPSAINLTIADRPAQILSVLGNQITFQAPQGIPTGPAILRLQIGSDQSLPIVVSIDAPPPAIVAVQAGFGTPIDSSRPARPGDLLSVMLSGLPDSATPPGRVQIFVGNVEHQPVLALPVGTSFQIQFILLPAVQTGTLPLTVLVDGRASLVWQLPVRAN